MGCGHNNMVVGITDKKSVGFCLGHKRSGRNNREVVLTWWLYGRLPLNNAPLALAVAPSLIKLDSRLTSTNSYRIFTTDFGLEFPFL